MLTAVDVTVNTTGTNFTVVPTGLLSLVSAASATRTLTFSVVAGSSTGGATNSLATTGGALLTLLGLGGANIGGAPLASTVPFTTPADLAAFSGNGTGGGRAAGAPTCSWSAPRCPSRTGPASRHQARTSARSG